MYIFLKTPLTAGGLQNRPVCAQRLKRVLTLMPEFKIDQTLTVCFLNQNLANDNLANDNLANDQQN